LLVNCRWEFFSTKKW